MASPRDRLAAPAAAPARDAPGHPARRVLAGVALAVSAVAFFAFMDTTTKYVTLTVPVLMTLWIRYMVQAGLTTLMLWPLRGARLLRTAHPRFQIARGLLLLLCSALSFFSLSYMPVGEFTAMVMVTPLTVTLVAATWLGEHVSRLRWLLVIGGFAGTLIILRPDSSHFGWPILLPLALIAANTGFQILTSRLAHADDPMTTHFYTGWIGAVLSSLPLPLVWAAVPSWELWALMGALGTAGAVGHLMLIQAYQRAGASVITPYLYAHIGFGMLGGWLVFSHLPDAASLLGIALIAVCGAAGAWLSVHEARRGYRAADG